MEMKNLKTETIDILKRHGKTTDDIRWVGSCPGDRYENTPFMEIPVEKFLKLSDRMYDDGFGGEEVNATLKVVGDSWWLERHEYDGSEWWEFKTLPDKPKEKINDDFLTAVFDKNHL